MFRARHHASSRVSGAIALVTMIAMVFHGSLPALASTETTLEGTVETPCDPSRRDDIVLVQLRPLSGGSPVTAAVDESTGAFVVPDLTAGEYDLVAIGVDGKPVSPEPVRLTVQEGSNRVALSMQPPGCGEDADGDGVPDAADACPDSPPGTAVGADGCAGQGGKRGGKRGLEDWHITLIYFGVVGAIILAIGEDEGPASPSSVEGSD